MEQYYAEESTRPSRRGVAVKDDASIEKAGCQGRTSPRYIVLKRIGLLLIVLVTLGAPKPAAAPWLDFEWGWGWGWGCCEIGFPTINLFLFDPGTLNVDFEALARAADEAKLRELETLEWQLIGEIEELTQCTSSDLLGPLGRFS